MNILSAIVGRVVMPFALAGSYAVSKFAVEALAESYSYVDPLVIQMWLFAHEKLTDDAEELARVDKQEGFLGNTHTAGYHPIHFA